MTRYLEKIALNSPIFRTGEFSCWREDIRKTWKYLHTHYKIRGDNTCINRIDCRGDPSFTLAELKQVAQAIIHFEPVFDALFPEPYAPAFVRKRNWRDNPVLGAANKSRSESIAHIEAFRPTQSNEPWEVATLIGERWHQDYCWEFDYSDVPRRHNIIKYHNTPVIENADAALMWADFIMAFIQASMSIASPARLQSIAANQEGLRYFVTGRRSPAGSTIFPTFHSHTGYRRPKFWPLSPSPIIQSCQTSVIYAFHLEFHLFIFS